MLIPKLATLSRSLLAQQISAGYNFRKNSWLRSVILYLLLGKASLFHARLVWLQHSACLSGATVFSLLHFWEKLLPAERTNRLKYLKSEAILLKSQFIQLRKLISSPLAPPVVIQTSAQIFSNHALCEALTDLIGTNLSHERENYYSLGLLLDDVENTLQDLTSNPMTSFNDLTEFAELLGANESNHYRKMAGDLFLKHRKN